MYQRTTPKALRRIEGPFRPSDNSSPAFKYRLMQSLSGSSPDVGVQKGQANRQTRTPLLNEFQGLG